MKPRTGNGTMIPQWIYIKIMFPYICWIKIGITGNLKARTKANSDKLPGIVIPVAVAFIPFAWQLEQWLHSWLPFNVRFKRFGKECYWLPAIIPALMVVAPIMFLEIALAVWFADVCMPGFSATLRALLLEIWGKIWSYGRSLFYSVFFSPDDCLRNF